MSQYACNDCDTTFDAPTDTDTACCPGCGEMAVKQAAPGISRAYPDCERCGDTGIDPDGENDPCAECRPVVPVSSPPPDQTADLIDQALHGVLNRRLGEGAWTQLRAETTAAVLAVLPEPADRAAVDRVRALHQPMQRGPFTICTHCSGWDGKWRCLGVVTDYPCATLRALNGETGDGPSRLAVEAQQPDTMPRPVQHAPGKAILCTACFAKGHAICMPDAPQPPAHIGGVADDCP
jgi:hypothetical protein